MVDSAKPVTGPWVISIVPVGCPNDLAGVPDGYIRAWEEHVGPVEPAGGDREDWIEKCARLYWGVRNLGDDAIVRVHGRWRGDDGSLAGCRISGMCSPTARRRTRWPTPRWPPATG